MTDYIKANDYAIGYIDSGHAIDNDLVEVKLVNNDGVALFSSDADIGAAATIALANNEFPAADADWSAVNLYDRPGNTTWPITMVSCLRVAHLQIRTHVCRCARAVVSISGSSPWS
eukprot:2003034-Pleurochrysis_carterae.AAC.1